ncbi:hypothetical protein SYNPS1DRAFT_12284, partial [Syncephalis pseudoplumigaleata]
MHAYAIVAVARNPTPPIPPGLFRWIPATLKLSEEFMLSHTGLDTVMHLRYLKTAFWLMMISTLIIASTLMPLNRRSSTLVLPSNSSQTANEKHQVELEIFSMSQIPNESPVLYVHMILTYVFTALAIWLFYRDMKAYEHLCREFNLSRVKDGMLCARTVMVTDLPKKLRSDESLRHYFTSLGIGQVEKAMVLRSSGKLHRRLARREQHLQELERLHIELARNILDAPNLSMDHDAYFNIWHTLAQLPRKTLDPFQPLRLSVRSHPSRQQPAIDYHLRKFNKQDRRVAELRASYARNAKPTATGFVTFVHPASAQLCAQSLISVEASRCRIQMAPTPRDIIWQNHKVNQTSRRARRTTVNIAVTVLTIFWFFFMSGVLVLTDLDKLFGKNGPHDQMPASAKLMSAFLRNTLPTLTIALLMSILPYILLRKSVHGATFFINYIVFSTCIHSLELIQLFIPFIYAVLMTSGIIRNTPRSLQQRTTPMSFPYFYYFPLHILMLVIAMIYAVINPLILIFAAIYFAIAYLVFKHQFAYAYVRRYETGGRYWRKAFTYTISCLLLVQITMIGVLSLKSMTIASLALAPPIILTIAFLLWCRKAFHRRLKYIPLESLRD